MSYARTQLPEYLKQYLTTQHYERYTARDHATWRCIMRQGRDIFGKTAHPVYLQGLKETGIPISRIPYVDEMDDLLDKFGWGAVCVEGFIPPAIFLAFQGHNLLPIACDMRTLEHIAYTPAPDIVHEAAGHAPILVDKEYAKYLSAYSLYANKAIYSREDVSLYEAIRALSDMKENPEYSAVDIQEAERKLVVAEAAITHVTEAGQLSRMNWWTAEYGLVGSLDKPVIFGAGLLSSLMEGEDCLRKEVKKEPLSLKCIQQGYDITNPQPQLFVARDFDHLTEVLEEFGSTMAFKVGGQTGLERALKAKTVTTTVFDHHFAISGILSSYDDFDGSLLLKWDGACQLCVHGSQAGDWGPDVLTTPLWQVVGKQMSGDNWRAQDKAVIEWVGGLKIEGVIDRLQSVEGQDLLIWKEAKLSTPNQVLELQNFPMVLSNEVTSVHGGCGDWGRFHDLPVGKASTKPSSQLQVTAVEEAVAAAYQTVRDLREKRIEAHSPLLNEVKEVLEKFPEEWLLALELYEEKHQNPAFENILGKWFSLVDKSLNCKAYDQAVQRLIQRGQRIADIVD